MFTLQEEKKETVEFVFISFGFNLICEKAGKSMKKKKRNSDTSDLNLCI